MYLVLTIWLWLDWISDEGMFKNYKLFIAIISTPNFLFMLVNFMRTGKYCFQYFVNQTLNNFFPGFLRFLFCYNGLNFILKWLKKYFCFCDDGLMNISFLDSAYIIKKSKILIKNEYCKRGIFLKNLNSRLVNRNNYQYGENYAKYNDYLISFDSRDFFEIGQKEIFSNDDFYFLNGQELNIGIENLNKLEKNDENIKDNIEKNIEFENKTQFFYRMIHKIKFEGLKRFEEKFKMVDFGKADGETRMADLINVNQRCLFFRDSNKFVICNNKNAIKLDKGKDFYIFEKFEHCEFTKLNKTFLIGLDINNKIKN
jgi:hypothetical protein